MSTLLKRGLAVSAAAPLLVLAGRAATAHGYLELVDGAGDGRFLLAVSCVVVGCLTLALGTAMSGLAIVRAARAEEGIGGALGAAAFVLAGALLSIRAILAPDQAPAAAPPSAPPPVAAHATGMQPLLGIGLAGLVFVGAVVAIRRVRRLVE